MGQNPYSHNTKTAQKQWFLCITGAKCTTELGRDNIDIGFKPQKDQMANIMVKITMSIHKNTWSRLQNIKMV